nr:ribonuclease H-like domain-containing protein [Tanacetum cinerariifolium]
MVSSVKLSILKKGEYILWTMKMKQYLAHTDYALWEVILNGNSTLQMTKNDAGNEIKVRHVTTQQILARTRERKAKSTLLMAIPDEHLARFHGIKDAKTFWDAIKTSFGEGLDKGYVRFQRLLSLLEIHGVESTSNTNEFNAAYNVSTVRGHSSHAQENWKKARVNGIEPVGFDKTKVECFNCHRRGHFARDCRSAKNSGNMSRDAGNAGNRGRHNGKRPAKEEDKQALVVQDRLGTYDRSYQVEEEATDLALMAFTSNPSSVSSSNYEEKVTKTVFDNRSSDEEDSLANDRFKKVASLTKDAKDAPKTSTACVEKSKEDRSNAPLIEDWDTDSDNDSVFRHEPIPAKINFLKTALLTRSGRIAISAAKLKAAASTSAAKPVNTAGPKQISVVKGGGVTAVKTSLGYVWRPRVNPMDQLSKDNRWICTRVDYGHPQQALKNKGIVDSGCFRHISGNKAYLADYQEINDGGKIRTEKLDFDDVYFVNELRFNLFFISQMCDKKNNVLFTETECLVLSLNFKLLDESQVLLRVPMQCNMYNFDLHNVVPSKGLTCLFTKASIDESNLWHKRLGHINFKTMNKLVKGNLVRGLPSKIFDNDHSCVTCQKGKHHKATCKAKLVSSISQPLQMLRMDLFGPTPVMSINHKKYFLIVTDDFSRALVTKTHNKTPYELLNGRTPRLDFMRPFGCPVTILNTLDPLRKFEGKADEEFLVGYSVTSKAFKVFNTKTKKVKENLHVRFLKNKPNVARSGSNWLFDIDSLTNSMNYIPVSAGNQTDKNAGPQDTNGNVGTQDNVDMGKEVSDQYYIMLPLWYSISFTFTSLDDKAADDKPKDDTGSKTVEEPVNKKDQAYRDELDRLMRQEKKASDAVDALRKESEQGCMEQIGVTKVGSTNSFNTVSNPVSAASTSGTFSAGGPSSPHPNAFIPANTLLHVDQDDSQIPDLEDTVKL